MRRKPIDIMADLINTMSGFRNNQAFNINEIKERANIHWKTAEEYLKLLNLVQKFAPQIGYNENKKSFNIVKYPRYFSKMVLEEQLIVYLFLEQAFDDKTAINSKDLFITIPQNHPEVMKIQNSKYISMISINNQLKYKFHLKRSGKFKAQGILANFNTKMADLIEDVNNSSLGAEELISNELVIIPFDYDSQYAQSLISQQYNCNEEMIDSKRQESYNHEDLFCSNKTIRSSKIA